MSRQGLLLIDEFVVAIDRNSLSYQESTDGLQEEVLTPVVRVILSLIGHRHLKVAGICLSGGHYDRAALIFPYGFPGLGSEGALS